MAIIDLFECQVLVNGKALAEYRYDENDHESGHPPGTKVAIRYIEAVPGTNFAIKFKVMRGYCFGDVDYLGVHVTLDGQLKHRPVVPKSHCSKSKSYSHTHLGVYSRTGTDSTIRKYQFGEIATRELSPSDTPANLKSRYGQLGSIRAEVWRKGLLSAASYTDVEYSAKTIEAVPKKALVEKALTVETRLLPASLVQARANFLQVLEKPKQQLRGRSGRVAVFEFKYRTKTSLQELLVIPRTPSPVPFDERPIEELNIDELRTLARRQKVEVAAARRRIKEEQASQELYAHRALKRSREDCGDEVDEDGEAVPKYAGQKKKRSDAETEVINLSD